MSAPDLWLLLVHLLATAALAGLIWTIQVVHYPLFDRVGIEGFIDYHHAHSFRISLLVGPLMGIELVAAVGIVWKRPTGVSAAISIVGLLLLGLVHLCTVFGSVPSHNKLGRGFNKEAYQQLVNTNWIRTFGWTLRALIAAQMIAQAATD
jgi:archaellum biogenesis protein FlaJ (TadC family)